MTAAAHITERMRARLRNADLRRLVIRELIVDNLVELRKGLTPQEARELDRAALDHAVKMLANTCRRVQRILGGET